MSTPILACTVRYEYFPMYVLTDYAYMEMMDELVNKPDNQWNLNFSNVSISDNQVTYSNVSKPDDRRGTLCIQTLVSLLSLSRHSLSHQLKMKV